jgi:two-component system, LytTR family, response regulator LytT
MLRVVVIDDEAAIAKHLVSVLNSLEENIEVLAILDSVEQSISWLSNHKCDLIISDVELGDGLSFDIFKEIGQNIPIIITTAFDSYAIRAFKENSVDYLLKPVQKEDLEMAISKFRNQIKNNQDFDLVMNLLSRKETKFQNRFLITIGNRMESIVISSIAYFFADERYTCLVSHEGRKHLINSPISELEEKSDPALFFCVNRKILVSHEAIRSIVVFSKRKLRIELSPSPTLPIDVVVSAARVRPFKKWLNGVPVL